MAEQLAEEILSLPMYAELTDEQIEYTIDAVLNFAG
jgi:dTDP-4-amino-4,6-dideoxygalactose transaminase